VEIGEVVGVDAIALCLPCGLEVHDVMDAATLPAGSAAGCDGAEVSL